MGHRLAVFAVLAAALLSACAHTGGERSLDAWPCRPRGLEVDAPIRSADACPSWRWVATKSDSEADCPRPAPVAGGSWWVGPLFASDDAGLPPALRPFCLYEVEDGVGESARRALNRSLARLVRQGRLERVESGCAAVAPAADEGSRVLWPVLRDHFLEQAGQMPAAEVSAPLVGPRVRLALLDTQPDGETLRQGRSNHGFTLARVAERLVCTGPGSCAARVVPRLALPIADFDWDDPGETIFDWTDGGYFGTIDQLAQGVWQELRAVSPDERLVLNLSVAWVGERFGGLEAEVSDMPVPVRALYRALEVASCNGALVVAASGNRLDGPEPEDGPLLPAAWERRPAPTAGDCRRLLGQPARWAADAPEPLVYAAGGVHGDDAPLLNARPGSTPARVAYADHAVVEAPDGGRTGILTGTSVGALLVSSAAAVVWHHRSDLRRREVMELVDRSGKPLGRRAELWYGDEAPEVRRVGVCPALALACAEGGRCPPGVPASCPPPPPEPPVLSSIDLGCALADFTTAPRIDAATLRAELETGAFCAASVRYDPAVGPPANPCPSRQFYALTAQPWTGPQPESEPCSGCSIRPPPPPPTGLAPLSAGPTAPVLVIDVDPEWPGGTLTSAVLTIGDEHFALGLEPLSAGGCAAVVGLDPTLFERRDDGTLPPVVLRFRTDRGSVSSPIFLGR